MGDGTVPYLSANMMGQVPRMVGFNKKYWYFAQDHTGIIKTDSVIRWIIDILKVGHSDVKSDDIISGNSEKD